MIYSKGPVLRALIKLAILLEDLGKDGKSLNILLNKIHNNEKLNKSELAELERIANWTPSYMKSNLTEFEVMQRHYDYNKVIECWGETNND